MVLAWRSYQSDLGRAYPMFNLALGQINEVSSNADVLALLPNAIALNLIETKNTCGVDGLTARSLILWLNDGGQFRLNYPQPFSQNLADYLTTSIQVTAWEFVGERIKYGRLKRMLENV